MLQEKVKELLSIRDEVAVKQEFLDEAKSRRDALQAEIMDEMKQIGFNSVKSGETSVAIAVRKTFKITDEDKVVAFLKDRGLAKEYLTVRLNEYAKPALEAFAKKGEVIDGTQIDSTEYISIRQTKKENNG